MSAHAFPFQQGKPFVMLTLAAPGFSPQPPLTVREDFQVDTGFSGYLQLDWDTFTLLNLGHVMRRNVTARLANGTQIVDILSLVRVIIPECGIDKIVRCITNPSYGKDLLLVGSALLKECNAVIDYPHEQTTLSD